MPTLTPLGNPERSHAIALVGFMGAGKSTVGAQLADRTGLPFVDLDALYVERFGPIEHTFATRGEAVFRQREAGLLEEVAAGPAVVLATGGGTPLAARNRICLERSFRTVHLDVSLDVAQHRIHGSDRPLADAATTLYADRKGVYRFASLHVNADLDGTTVCEAVQRALRTPTGHTVRLAPPYDVFIQPGFDGLRDELERHAFDRWIVVTDDTVAPLWSASLLAAIGPCPVLTIPAGEANKTLLVATELLDAVLQLRPSRKTAVLALGGGVVGDLAGFVASICNRGMPVVQLPTTTLAMIDSSVGGKTAVNHALGKNLIGSFHQPVLVWAATKTLSTLPPRHVRAGIVEAVKMAASHGAVAFETLEAIPSYAPELIGVIIRAAISTKASVVERDEVESGERKLLNLGHTVGHALEKALGFGHLLHGEAVALGLLCETEWAIENGHCEPAVLPRLRRVLEALEQPTAWPPGVDEAVFTAALTVDKKARHDTIELPVLSQIGRAHCETVSIIPFARRIFELAGQRCP